MLERPKALTRRILGSTPAGRARRITRRYRDAHGDVFASALTYRAFLSMVPLLLLAMSVIGFAVATRPTLATAWTSAVEHIVPGLGSLLGDQLSALSHARAGTGIAGLAGLAWIGTSAVEAAGAALNAVFGIRPHRAFLRRRAWAMGSLFCLGVLLLVSVAIAAAVGSVHGHGAITSVLRGAAIAIELGLDSVLFLIAYRLLSHREGPPARALVPGAAVAGTGWTIIKLMGTWYAQRTVAHSALIYGTFAGTVGVLVILSMGSRLFLIGAAVAVTGAGRDDVRADVRSVQSRRGEPGPRVRRDESHPRARRRAS